MSGCPKTGCLVMLTLAVLPISCAPKPPADLHRFDAEAAAIKAECSSRPTNLARARCSDARLLGLNLQLGWPRDVVTAYFARREAIAEQIDLGKITQTEGDAEIAEAQERATAEMQRRLQAAQPLVCTTNAGLTVCN